MATLSSPLSLFPLLHALPVALFLFLFLLPLVLLPAPTAALSSKLADTRGVPSDVKYIRCQVCAQVARAAATRATELPSARAQLDVLDMVESLCAPGQKGGRWMRGADLVERVGKLVVEPQEGQQQECRRECHTMALACRDVVDGVETELAERLYAWGKEAEGKVDAGVVEDWLCARKGGASGACAKRTPVLPREREKGPPFVPKAKKDVDMENLMEDIRGANGDNFGMDMLNRNDMGAGMKGTDGSGSATSSDDDDDDSDDENTESGKVGDDESDLQFDGASLGEAGSADLDALQADAAAAGSAASAKTSTLDMGSDEL